MAILGIDLGTTNSLVGVVDAGFPILLADGEGQRITPSAVYYPENGDPPVVGRAALRQRLVHPTRTVTSVKRLMGKRAGEIDPAVFPFSLGGEPGQPIHLNLPWGEHASLTPEIVSSHVLAHLRKIAVEAMGEEMNRAIITVPAYFNDAQRQATKRAGELAGLTVERILNEPTAAALSFGLHKSEDRSHIVVYDFGGGTFDVSILEIRDGVFHVLATHGDSFLGGDDIDHVLAEALWKRYAPNRGELDDQDIRLRLQFREAAARAKIALSSVPETEVNLPFIEGDRSFTCEFARTELVKLARPIVERTRRHCRQALQDADLALERIDHVILVGGTTRMPLVRELAADIFQQAPNTSEHPDESVALGAVIQGGILSGDLRNVVLLDVTPLSLGIESFGGLMNVIIPRNTTIPTKAGEMFTNAVTDQSSMLIRVLQGEREMARDNWELGRVEIPFRKGPKGSARVGVQFQIDENGILEVLARDTQEGKDVVLRIQNAAVDVDDVEVEKMISQSVDHAFEDMSERILTEEKLKSDELLLAVEQALESVGDAIESSERQIIETSAKEVKAALASGDVSRLKAANRDLDEATQALAALLMEKAMEEAMEKRLQGS